MGAGHGHGHGSGHGHATGHVGVRYRRRLGIAFAAIFVAFMLWLTRKASQKMGFNRADTIAIEFCGSKKSLATGLPMASVIFASGGASLGLLILPLMIYYQVQLMMCSWLAARYAQHPGT